MNYGIELIPFGPYSDPREVMRVARAAEAAGWEALCVWDHMLMPYGAGDPWVALTAAATVTRRLKLATGVAAFPRYRPHTLARTLAALDQLSEGRVIFGVGAGVDFDFAPFGEALAARDRAAMLDEGLPVVSQLLAGKTVTHHGPHFRLEAVRLVPAATQRPRPPFWIGGVSPPALRRAARWDGWIIGTIDESQALTLPPERLAEHVAVIRRHRTSGEPFAVAVDGVTAGPTNTGLVRDFAQAGATWWFEAIYGSRAEADQLVRRIQAGPPHG
jgi:alkanesulfonate monooxygenase SsuD/methylene tetrahydromethanopterin reductase-like flavin-dependent oxidoreductase (luciferase family)